MGLFLCLSGFAAAYAVTMFLGGWISVSSLGWWDPQLGDAANNLRVMRQILPIVVAATTLLALLGARTYQEWLQRNWGLAVAAGSGAGVLTAVALFTIAAAALEVVPRVLPEAFAMVLLAAVRILVLAVPAIVAYLFIGFVRRKVVSGRAV